MKDEIMLLPSTLVGKVIGKKDEYIEIFTLTNDEMELLLKEVAKFDYKFNRGVELMTVETKIGGVSMFVEISENQYKTFCDLYFKNKLEEREEEM